jgi:hypothetical protein
LRRSSAPSLRLDLDQTSGGAKRYHTATKHTHENVNAMVHLVATLAAFLATLAVTLSLVLA